jgi:hypothetical protein
MKAAVVFLCLSVTAFAQQKERYGQQPGQNRLAAACGPANVNYKVNLDRSQHGPIPPEAGKALVYFIHDAGIPFESLTIGYPTTKYGVDGSWVGAGHGDSWFAVAVAPGEHHVCTVLQSSFVDQRVELARSREELLLPHTTGDVQVGGIAGTRADRQRRGRLSVLGISDGRGDCEKVVW